MVNTRKLKDEAAAHILKGRHDKALALLQEVVQAEPADHNSRRNLGDLLLKLSRPREAIQVYIELANFFASEGFLLKAIATFKRVLELDPGHTEIQARLAELYARRQGRGQHSVRVMEDAPGAPAPALAAIELEPTEGPMELVGASGAARPVSPQAPIMLDAFAIEAVEIEPIVISSPATPLATLNQVASDANTAPLEDIPPEALGRPDDEPLELETQATEPALELEPLLPAATPPSTEEPSPPPDPQPEAAPEPAAREPLPAEPRPLTAQGLPSVDIELSFDEPTGPRRSVELSEIPLFSDLEPDAFIALVERLRVVPIRPGDWVLREGEEGASMFTIASGKVRVLKRLDAKKMLQLAVLDEGQFFGEMSVLRGDPRGASIQAVEAGELFEISRELLDSVRQRYPSVDAVLKKFTQQRLLRNVMGTSPLFRPFSKQERVAIIERFVSRDVDAGVELVTEGRESDGLYLVLRGSMDVLCVMADGGLVSVGEIREGEVFGEISCLQKRPAIATVRAKTPATVLRLPREDFDSLVMSHPQILELVSEIGETRIVLTSNALARQGILV
jgi:CRP-like cAMP-binding protein